MTTLRRFSAGPAPMIFTAVVIAAAFIVAACSDSRSPVSPGAAIGGETAANPNAGQGNCGTGTFKDETAPYTITAPAGQVFTAVWVKAGSTQNGGGCVLLTTAIDTCYNVSGLGTSTVTVTNTGAPGCFGISHIEGVVGTPTPTPTPTPKPTPTPTPDPKPTPTPTPKA
jgi:hypothetical protein